MKWESVLCTYTDSLPSTAEEAVCYDRLTHLALGPLEHIIACIGQKKLTTQPFENALAAEAHALYMYNCW